MDMPMDTTTDTGKAKTNMVFIEGDITIDKKITTRFQTAFYSGTFVPPKSFIIPDNTQPGELLKYVRCVRT